MKKTNVKGLIGATKTLIVKHSPEIMTGIGIAGMITTTILSVKATPKALMLIEEEKRNHWHETGERIEKLKPIDVIKTTWKCYIPSVVTGALSVTCLVGASSTNLRRNAALATAYKLSETALTEYKDAVIETIGEKAEQEVKDKVAENQLKKNPASKNEIIIVDGNKTLCFEAISGRYFYIDVDKIKRAENKLNSDMLREMYVSLNDFYDEIDLEPTNIGEELGWNLDDGLLEIKLSAQLTDNDEPCLVIDYGNGPKYNYYHLA